MKIKTKASQTKTQENENMRKKKTICNERFGENNLFLMEHKNVIK